jgi:hypothetical protein
MAARAQCSCCRVHGLHRDGASAHATRGYSRSVRRPPLSRRRRGDGCSIPIEHVDFADLPVGERQTSSAAEGTDSVSPDRRFQSKLIQATTSSPSPIARSSFGLAAPTRSPGLATAVNSSHSRGFRARRPPWGSDAGHSIVTSSLKVALVLGRKRPQLQRLGISLVLGTLAL